MQQRLQKILSARGISSRRKAEEYIEQGLVKVNGKVVKLGDKADPEIDKIEVDGKVLEERATMKYFVMMKPVGVETVNITRTTGTRTVRDLLPRPLQGKVFPVGRLDKDSSGLLLFTNDGVLSYRLTHPKFTHDKEYEVIVDRPITPMVCRQIEEGIEMDGSRTKPLKAKKVGPTILRIILTEGKNRQIRRMIQHVGFTVKELRRIRIMTLTDPEMKIGTVRELSKKERELLLQSVGLESD
ncbi:MAG: pseudouridine synthase [Candidatus Peribacteraceae bacterium]